MSIIQGDCLKVLPTVAENSVDCIVTDPPYGVAFMGMSWDKALPNQRIWSECLRVLKPGAHIFVMALPRMYHRVAVAIEDAGFVINSNLVWLFASGFPKALDIGKAFDKRAFVEWLDSVPHELTAAEKRKVVSAAVNGGFEGSPNRRQAHKKSGMGFDAAIGKEPLSFSEGARLLASLLDRFWNGNGRPPGVRVKVGERESWRPNSGAIEGYMGTGTFKQTPGMAHLSAPSTPLAQQWDGWKSPQLKPAHEMIVWASKPLSEKSFVENAERWGTGGVNVDAGRIPTDWNDYGEGWKRSGHGKTGGANSIFGITGDGINISQGRYPATVIAEEGCVLDEDRVRFFNLDAWARTHGVCDVPKASKAEKEAGLEGVEAQEKAGQVGMKQVTAKNWGDPEEVVYERNTKVRNLHPTVKPIALMAWLISLGCSPGGLVLDPFCGTGTTLIAAEKLGMEYLGIELDERWCDIAERRVGHWTLEFGKDPAKQLALQEAGA